MAHTLETVEIIRQYDPPVRLPQGVSRFITIRALILFSVTILAAA